MDRAENISLNRNYRDWICIAVLVIFYAVGLTGISIAKYRADFLPLSAMNLLLSLTILVISRKTQKQLFLVFLFVCFLTGMLAEWIGIHTGWLFGDYQYDDNLGIKFSGVPLIIGVNWGILSVTCCTVVSNVLSRFSASNQIVKALFSAFLMMLLDVLIEPVAIDSGYWHWNSENIPVFNYICWFAVAFPLHFVYFRWKLDEQNKVSIALWIILVIFFTVLNFR